MGETRALPLAIEFSVGSATIRSGTTVIKKAGPLTRPGVRIPWSTHSEHGGDVRRAPFVVVLFCLNAPSAFSLGVAVWF